MGVFADKLASLVQETKIRERIRLREFRKEMHARLVTLEARAEIDFESQLKKIENALGKDEADKLRKLRKNTTLEELLNK